MIGEEYEETLLCLTDFYQFFNESEVIKDIGQWYFFNGSAVTLNTSNDIYMTNDLGVARLHRRNKALIPTETFRCEIPDSNNITQSIYIRVYYESMLTTTSPTVTVEEEVSGAILGGAALGGMLLMVIITAGIILALLFAIRR